jgi:hypothetical protein
MTTSTPLTIRLARPDDGAALGVLAQLDSASVPPGPVLLAETGGRLLAALSLSDGASVADPFEPTARVLELLRFRIAGGTAYGESTEKVARGLGLRALSTLLPRAHALAHRH